MGAWVNKIEHIHHLRSDAPKAFARMRATCRNRVKETYTWEGALADILGESAPLAKTKPGLKPTPETPPDAVWELKVPVKGVA
jgi:hypothetical protein